MVLDRSGNNWSTVFGTGAAEVEGAEETNCDLYTPKTHELNYQQDKKRTSLEMMCGKGYNYQTDLVVSIDVRSPVADGHRLVTSIMYVLLY